MRLPRFTAWCEWEQLCRDLLQTILKYLAHLNTHSRCPFSENGDHQNRERMVSQLHVTRNTTLSAFWKMAFRTSPVGSSPTSATMAPDSSSENDTDR